MTRFERDKKDALEGSAYEVLARRKAEIGKLEKEGRCCKNSFRRTCIAQELEKLIREYNEIDSLI